MHPIPRDRLDYLDGLRGWAALSVVIFHCTWELFGSFLPLVRTSYASLLNDGNLAVYIFFVLSGLVLSHGFLVTSDVARLQRLAIGRYLRLAIPIAAASLICLLLLEYGLMFNTDAVKVVGRPDWLGMPYQMAPSVLSWARFFSFDVFFHYDFYSSYDSVLWTMPIELTGSYIVFGLLALSGARRRARLIYCAASLTILWLVNPIMCTFVYGVLIAQLMRSRTYRRLSSGMTGNLLGLACFAAACVGSVFNRGDLGNTTPAYLAIGAILGPVLSPALRRLFESAVSRWLGPSHSRYTCCTASSYIAS